MHCAQMQPGSPFKLIKALDKRVKMIPKNYPKLIYTPVLMASPIGCVSSTPKSIPTGRTLTDENPTIKLAIVASHTFIDSSPKSNPIGETAVINAIAIKAFL